MNALHYKIIDSMPYHLEAVAKCHQKAFPKSLSSAMGIRYLKKMLDWYLAYPYTFMFHLEQDAKCIGYCGGLIVDGTRAVGSASGMMQHSFNAAVQAILLRPWLLLHREFLKKYRLIWKNIVRRFYKRLGKKDISLKPPQAASQYEPHVGLVVIGVDNGMMGKGYGSILLQEFERRASEVYGIRKLQLSVKADNAQAIRAYERNGWYKGEQQGESLSMYKNL